MSDYFQLIDDVDIPGRWFLDSARDASGRAIRPEDLRIGAVADVAEPLTISVRKPGRALDWTYADFDMPVASEKTASIFQSIANEDLQLLAATVEGSGRRFVVPNFLRVVDCVDEARSNVLKWTAEQRPDRAGDYRQIIGLKIRPDVVTGLMAFRVKGWRIALIVSRDIKTAFEQQAITGASFAPV